jgi:hypothetical protein
MKARNRQTSSVRNPHKLAGSSTHSSLHTEPSFIKLRASHADTSEGLPHEYNSHVRPSRGKRFSQGKGTKDNPYWKVPKEYGPNYHHNLAKEHFAEGGNINPHTGHPQYGFIGNILGGLINPSGALSSLAHMLPFSEGGTAKEHAKGGKWIQGAIKHPGALHMALKVPKGHKIPEMKLEKASHSSSPVMRKRANLALTLKGFHHKG